MSAAHDSRLERITVLQKGYHTLQKDLPLLEDCIDLLRSVIADESATNLDKPGLDSSLAQYRHDLGAALFLRFMHVNETIDLVEAETHLRLACPHFPSNASSFSTHSILGSVLRERAYETQNRPLAEEALSLHRQPFLAGPGLSILDRARRCRELGLTLRVRFLNDRNRRSDLEESIRQLKDSRALYTSMGVTDHVCSAGLVLALTNIYVVQMNEAPLEEAASLCDLALTECKTDHRDFYRVLWSVVSARRWMAWSRVVTVPLFRTIQILHDVLANPPSGWAPPLINELIDALVQRFEKEGDEEALSEAIIQATTLLDSLSPEVTRWHRVQAYLADMLRLRFCMTGAAEDIENAVRAAELALSSSNTGALNQSPRLTTLALCRMAQHRPFGDVAHLSECIMLLEQVALLAFPQSSNQLLTQHNLVDTLTQRAKATGDLNDLNRAIEMVPGSTSSPTYNHPRAPMMLHEVGNAFLLRFEMANSLDDLERATTWHYGAVRMCQMGPALGCDHHNIVNAYAKVLRIRCEVLRETESAVKALVQQKQLLDTLPTAHADRAKVLCGLAQTLICVNPTAEDVEMALDHLLDALNNDYCPAYRRLKDGADVLTYMAKRLTQLDHGNALKLCGVYSTAISLLPQVASFGLDPRTRLAVISGSGQLVAQGSTHAMSVGQHQLALEMLEAGRNIFWTQGLHLRTPFADLPPAIGDRLKKITSALGQPMPEFAGEGAAKDRELARRRHLGDEFKRVLAEARLLSGFEDLLQNTSFESLARASHKHPIAVLVAGENVGYALIVLQNAQCSLVTLGKATDAALKALSQRIGTHSQHKRSTRGVRLTSGPQPTDVYRDLWTIVMLPIIKVLGWPKSQGRERRRLILCPTGLFMQLPLHAAGIYTGDKRISCSDYFVSTYVPSIGALLHAQQTYRPVRRADADTMVVAVERPFEGEALPLTSKEATTVRDHVSPSAKVIQVSTSMDVFEHIQSKPVLHMACHGTQNLADALQSGFFLEDELLPVSKLMQLELPRAFLAVLSACETTKGDATQPDQAIHLAATMLFAGFKSVVATMWFMRDLEGPTVAESIYSALFKDDGDSEYLDPDDVPYALDEAVRKMRESGLDPSFWATYVHIGI